MPEEFLHDRKDFNALIDTVAANEKINDPALVEKDYWIMHSLYGLKILSLAFELKGGTSLSKGFDVIQRFSEDIDIHIEPFDGMKVSSGPNHDKPTHIESRRQFFEALKNKIKISGIKAVDRDTEYDAKSFGMLVFDFAMTVFMVQYRALKTAFFLRSDLIRQVRITASRYPHGPLNLH